MAGWDQKYEKLSSPIRLDSGAILVTESALIRQILHDQENYVDESAFLRTRNFFPLPHEQRINVVRQFIRIMSPATDLVSDSLSSFFEAKRTLKMQSDGIWMMYALYKDKIWDPQRSADYGQYIEHYIARKTIHDDVQGGFRRLQGLQREQLDVNLGNLLRADSSGPHHDLVSVVKNVQLDLTPVESSELLLRLVQSLVAFTGVAFEFSLYYLALHPQWLQWIDSEERAKAFVLELQRLYPTAWRLTRTAKQSHHLDGIQVIEGDDVILGHSVAHKNFEEWGRESQEFQPDRWIDQSPTRILTFGSGPGACPGKNIALNILARSLLWASEHFAELDVVQKSRSPYVRSILAAPRLRLSIRKN
ncbi:hypothetical protein AOZ07_11480 [Glutamicibacter halophytocola]|uniref:cytochrome P450 n=1 Tax=Glutamicibacter halophytocola TaxID=1933880 RepID=UPI0006D4AE47|nr:cytochrome P450 [Glutamicibacter halophytocola]ALG29539.1 hypothetical protein AOZ07_11480 [Glutamicibacter halophytocola]